MRTEFKKVSEYIIKYYHITDDSPFHIEKVNAADLLTGLRFDLAAKLYYIDCKMKNKSTSLAKKLYQSHIEAFQDGVVVESGNKEKSGMDRYFDAFDHLIEDFANDQFDFEKDYIPVDGRGEILDGAHRTACGIYFGKELKIIRFPHVKGITFDASFFRKRCLANSYLRIMSSIYPQYRDDTLLLIFWPRALHSPHYRKVIRKLKSYDIPIIYYERIKLDYEELLNLVYVCYEGEPWVGSEKNFFLGVRKKATSCFTGKDQAFELYLLEGLHCKEMTDIKSELREILKMKKRGIHSTDTSAEADRILKRVFHIDEMEDRQRITVTKTEKLVLTIIRKLRNCYTRMLIRIKKILGMPV